MGFKPLILGLLIIVPAVLFTGVHQVREGYVGMYWRGGALLPGFTEPGYHLKLPITRVAEVQMTLQTDVVTRVPCGTSDGVMLSFDKVECVNQLRKDKAWETVKQYGVNYDQTWIFDKVHHEINQFCSSHTVQEVYIDLFEKLDEALLEALQKDCDKWDTGIQLIAIRVTKPRIPDAVRRNYEHITEERTSLRVAMEHARVVQAQEEAEKVKATIQAEMRKEVARLKAEEEAEVAAINARKESDVSLIKIQQLLKEKEGEAEIALIENRVHTDRQKAIADALAYAIRLEAEANQLLLTEKYLERELYRSIANNTKIYYGEKIPQIFSDWRERVL